MNRDDLKKERRRGSKVKILNSEVYVNRKICRLRGKKLKNSDIVEVDGVEYIVKNEN